jgi:hypothetical protein
MAKNQEGNADGQDDLDEEVETGGEVEGDQEDQSDEAEDENADYEDEDEEDEDDEDDIEPGTKKARHGLPEETIRVFEQTEAQLEGFYEEIGNISKKKPDDAINKFKLGFINQMLERANNLLAEKYRPFPDFVKFDPDALPTSSDVVTMLAQYLRSMDKFRKDHTYEKFSEYLWYVSDSHQKIRAKMPKNFAK